MNDYSTLFDPNNIYDSVAIDKNGYHKRPWKGNGNNGGDEGSENTERLLNVDILGISMDAHMNYVVSILPSEQHENENSYNVLSKYRYSVGAIVHNTDTDDWYYDVGDAFVTSEPDYINTNGRLFYSTEYNWTYDKFLFKIDMSQVNESIPVEFYLIEFADEPNATGYVAARARTIAYYPWSLTDASNNYVDYDE